MARGPIANLRRYPVSGLRAPRENARRYRGISPCAGGPPRRALQESSDFVRVSGKKGGGATERSLLNRERSDGCLQLRPFPRIVTPVSSRPRGVSALQHGSCRAIRDRRPARLGERVRRSLTALAVLAGATLVLFHVALFVGQAGAGRLVEPALAVKWSVSVLLCLALVALRRAGVPLLRGRRALAVWLLAGLLHWNTAPGPESGPPILPQVIVELQSSAGLALLGTGLLLAMLTLRRAQAVRARHPLPRAARVIGRASPPLSLHLASRAPPSCCLA